MQRSVRSQKESHRSTRAAAGPETFRRRRTFSGPLQQGGRKSREETADSASPRAARRRAPLLQRRTPPELPPAGTGRNAPFRRFRRVPSLFPAVFLRPGFGCGRSPGAFKDAGLFRAQSALPGTDEKRRPQHATAVSSAIPFPWCSAGGTRHAEPSSPPASPGIRLFPSDTPRTRPCPSDARTS